MESSDHLAYLRTPFEIKPRFDFLTSHGIISLEIRAGHNFSLENANFDQYIVISVKT